MEENLNYSVPEGTTKPTYEQLEKQVYQMAEKANDLYNRLQEANLYNVFRRLDYDFKVLENSKHFEESFIKDIVTDVVEIMTIKNPLETE